MIAFMQQHKWTKIVCLCTTENVWFQSRLKLTHQLTAAGMAVFNPAAFEPGHLKDSTLSEVKALASAPWLDPAFL